MKSYLEYLTEATLDQVKDVFKKGEYSREKTDLLYKEMFNKKGLKTDDRKYRIYLPFKFDMTPYQKELESPLLYDGLEDFEDFRVRVQKLFSRSTETLKNVYHAFNAYIDDGESYEEKLDYLNGYVFDLRGRPIKIAKLLRKVANEQPNLTEELESLIKKFNEDRLRDGTSKYDYNNLMIVITKNPIDVLNQSTDRRWTSCMNLNKKEMKRYVPEDLKHGTILAYLTNTSDTKIQNPIARVSIKPYKGLFKDKTMLVVSGNCHEVIYGSFKTELLTDFQYAVTVFVNDNYNKKKIKNPEEEVFKPSPHLYQDENDRNEVNVGKIDTEPMMQKTLDRMNADAVYDTGIGYWVFARLDNGANGIIKENGKIQLYPMYDDIQQVAGDKRLFILKQNGRYYLYDITQDKKIYNRMDITYMNDSYNHADVKKLEEFYQKNPKAETELIDVEFSDGSKGYMDLKGNIVYKY